MTKKDTELAVAQPNIPGAFPIETLLQSAVDKGVPVETMERLLAMRRDLKAEQAKEAFGQAMADFQAQCPVIEKKKLVKDGGRELYRYAPIEDIVEQVKPILGRNGLSYAFQTEMTPTHVKVTCIAKHVFGHSESTSVEFPLSTRTGIMSAPQQVAATTTFGKRYAFCNAFGIMTGEADIDGHNLPSGKQHEVMDVEVTPPPKTTKPLVDKTRDELNAELHALLAKYGMPREKFKEKYQVASMTAIPDDTIRAAIKSLRERTNKGELWRDESLPTVDVSEPTVDEVIGELPPDLGGTSTPADKMRAGMKGETKPF